MSQKQMIDFTTSRPTGTADFSLRRYEGGAYDNEKKCWLINPLGSMRFRLNLDSRRGINLVFKLSPLSSNGTSCRIDITINGKIYVEKEEWKLSCGSNCHTWHIPQLMLQTGDNDIVLKLHDGALLSLAGVHMFVMQNQQHEFWCWSAVATSISKYYDPNSSLTQCKLVNFFFNNKIDCCQQDKGKTEDCNKSYYISKALIKTGNLAIFKKNENDLEMIHNQANEGKPIAVSMSFGGAGGHVVVVTGVGIDDMIAVDDPWYGPSYMKYKEFKDRYQGYGKWFSCCLTKVV